MLIVSMLSVVILSVMTTALKYRFLVIDFINTLRLQITSLVKEATAIAAHKRNIFGYRNNAAFSVIVNYVSYVGICLYEIYPLIKISNFKETR
jgi:hypothetical protein